MPEKKNIRPSIIRLKYILRVSRTTAFDFIVDPANMTLFSGTKRIPGIASVVPINNVAGVGARYRVQNTDGTEHEEEVVEFEQGECYGLRIDTFPPKTARVLSYIRERMEFRSVGENITEVDRSFALHPRPHAVARLATRMIIAPAFRRAMRRHFQAIERVLESGDATRTR